MPLNIACPGCYKAFNAPEEYLGKKVKCPLCKTAFVVQLPSTRDATPEHPSGPPPLPLSPGTLRRKGASPLYTMEGVGGLLEVFEDRVTIAPKGVIGFLSKGIKGTKEIPFTSIIAVQFKEADDLFNGYLQFTIPGGNESRGGILAATQDENTFMFSHTKNNTRILEIKEYIDSAVRKSNIPQAAAPTATLSDELQKLAQLKQQGLLSELEFQDAKRRLIG